MNNNKKDTHSSAFSTFKKKTTFKNETSTPAQRSISIRFKSQNRSKNKEEPETNNDYIYKIDKH